MIPKLHIHHLLPSSTSISHRTYLTKARPREDPLVLGECLCLQISQAISPYSVTNSESCPVDTGQQLVEMRSRDFTLTVLLVHLRPFPSLLALCSLFFYKNLTLLLFRCVFGKKNGINICKITWQSSLIRYKLTIIVFQFIFYNSTNRWIDAWWAYTINQALY